MAVAKQQSGIGIRRHFTTEGVHPYDAIEWERRDSRISDYRTGAVAFEQLGVELPVTWSMNATNILAQKYFRGTLGTPEREWSLRQVVDRVADTIADWGQRGGYFADEAETNVFRDELKALIVNQRAAFNSPVWFNVGVKGVPQQASACFILAVDDSMDAILNWYVEEGTIFKGGSGSGVNLSKIRSSKELLKGGGTASGPVSFMRGADASAGTIKCLSADTEIVTSDGVVTIRDVRTGSQVVTRHGLRTVAAVHANGRRSLLALTTALGDRVRCTPEHRFWVRRDGHEGWVEAGQLVDGDHVLLDASGVDPGRLQELRIPEAGHHNEIRRQLPAVLNEPLALWLGWTFGDGSIVRRPPANFITVQLSDVDDNAARYQELVGSLFGDVNVFESRHLDKQDASTSLRFCSTLVTRFLELNGLVKSSAATLSVPALVKSSPSTVRAAFLAGLFEADGHIGNGYPTLSTVSEQLATDVHRLLWSLGIPSKLGRIDDRDTAYGQRPVHTVRVVGGEGVRRFAKLVGFVSERKQQLLEAAVERKSSSKSETQWMIPGVQAELARLWEGGDRDLRRALSPYCRYQQPRTMSLLRARSLLERFPEQLAGSVTERFASGTEFWTPVRVAADAVDDTFDLTVEDVHEYLVHNLVTHNSGGKTRRAAKMVILDADHPDVRDFIWCKAREERKAHALAAAGFDMDLDGLDSHSIQYQNANNSVRVTDEFMQAVVEDKNWQLTARTTGEVVETVRARDLFREIAEAAWECADPGLQYDTTINKWHTAPNTGKINASNPCSEYVHLDNSACNLASLNLLRFLNSDDTFDVEGFKAAVEVVFTAQEILVGNADYPTEKIAETTRRFRELGLGYANLGALLMALGMPYDSDEARATTAAITALMTGEAYATSARIASRMGPFAGYQENEQPMLEVLRMHRAEVAKIDEERVELDLLSAAQESWDEAVELAERHGVRNSQATVLAPTGTISFLMDCDTTGIEPDLGLVKTKKLVGGGTMSIVNQTIPRALRRLGYSESQAAEIVAYIDEHKSILGAPGLRAEHLPVFACSMGDNTIHYTGHVKMMAAAQPYISGAISKTANLPEEATVEEIEQLYIDAWRMGLKAVAIYRDNCKVGQPLATTKKEGAAVGGGAAQPSVRDAELQARIAELEGVIADHVTAPPVTVRRRLPRKRTSKTFAFRVADCEGYVTVGEYEDHQPGEVFIKVSKQGSTLSGVMDAFAIAVSLGLQHGVPLSTFVRKYTNIRFEPAGITDDPELRLASSLVDYIFRRLALDYLPFDERIDLGILSTSERSQPTLPGLEEIELGTAAQRERERFGEGGDVVPPERRLEPLAVTENRDAPFCYACGNIMQRAGSCYACPSCGATSGCS